MKAIKTLIGILILGFVLPLSAQIPSGYVQTTATVSVLANARFGASWTNLSASPQLGLLGCVSTFQTTVNGNFDAYGSFSVLLADTSQICPSPSTWTFTITFACPVGVPASSFTVQVPVTGGGGTEDISSQITAALPSTSCSGGGGGGGGTPAPPNFSAQFNNGHGSFGGTSLFTIDSATGAAQPSTVAASGPPILDIRNPGFAGGATCDGVTDIGPALQAAWNALPANGGTIQIVGNPNACYWAHPDTFQWGSKTGQSTFQMQGTLQTGNTFNIVPGLHLNLECANGANATQFQGGYTCQIYTRPSSNNPIFGTLGTTITPDYVGSGNPTGSTPVACNATNSGKVYQDTAVVQSVYWTCASTTGSGTGGATTLTVTNSGGFVKDDVVNISGVSGTYTITSISGTSWTVSPALAGNATAAAVTINTTYQHYSNLSGISGWIEGAVKTVTPSTMNGITGGNQGTALGLAGTMTCSLNTLTRSNNVVTATFASTTGTISATSSTLTVSSAVFPNGAILSIPGANGSIPLVATVVSGGGTTTLALSAPAASSVTSGPVNQICHIAPDAAITVAGVSDSSFNGAHSPGNSTGPWVITNPDYVANTLTWTQSSAANGSSTGGTITGLSKDNIETILVGDTTSTTFTARFFRPHVSTDQFGAVSVYVNNVGIPMHIKDAVVVSDGPGIVLAQTYRTRLEHVGSNGAGPCGGNLTNFPLDIQISSFNYLSDVAFQAGCYPGSIHENTPYNIQYAGNGPTTISDSALTGGVWLDYNGQGVDIKNSFCEQCVHGAISYDDTHLWNDIDQVFSVQNVDMQDNPAGYAQCMVWSETQDTQALATVSNIYTATRCPANQYMRGSLKTDNTNEPNFGAGTVPFGIVQGSGGQESELRGEGASFGPSLVPYPTLNVDQTGSTWTGTCTVTTGLLGPDQTTTAVSTSGANTNQEIIGTDTITPAVGDFVLFGTYAYTATPNQPASVGGTASAVTVSTGGSAHWQMNNTNAEIPAIYDLAMSNDWWHPTVGIAQVTYADGSSGQTLSLDTGCDTQKTLQIWKPWMMYIPASAGIPQAEIYRWRQQLMHGAVPPNYNAPSIPATPEAITTNGYYLLNHSGSTPINAFPMTTLGDMTYGGASGVPTRLAGSTSASTLCLTQTGTGSASAAPLWGSCSGSAATAFSAITGSTNTSAPMVVGTGASMAVSGTGTIQSTSTLINAYTNSTPYYCSGFGVAGSGQQSPTVMDSSCFFQHGVTGFTQLTLGSNLNLTTTTAATSGANVNSPPLYFLSNYWNGSASTQGGWSFQNVYGTGSNPTQTLTLATAAGSTSGVSSVSFPFAFSANSFSGAGTGLTGTAASLSIGGNAATASVAINLSGGSLGSLPYQSAANTTTYLSGNTTTTPEFVTSTGTGSAAQAPVFTSSTGSGNVVLSAGPTLTGTVTGVNLTLSGVPTFTGIEGAATYCVQVSSAGVLSNTGAACGSGGGGGGVTSFSGTGIFTNSSSTGAVTLTLAGTSGGIPYFSSTSQLSSSALLATNHILLGGGAAGAPTSDSKFDDSATTANTLTYSGTGGIAATGGPITAASPAGDAGLIAIVGNTTNPTCFTNQFCIFGFNSASATAYGWQPSTTAPSGTQFMTASTPSSGASTVNYVSSTGSGNVVLATSATLVSPALGTPTALVLTNATGLPVAGGGTGASTATGAVSNLLSNPAAGIYSVNCTSGSSCASVASPFTCTDGLDATSTLAASGWPLAVMCPNTTGVTMTITAIKCYVDGGSGTTVTVSQLKDNSGNNLLSGTMTCSTTGGSGTQSATTTIANGGFIRWAVTPDGTAQAFTIQVSGTY